VTSHVVYWFIYVRGTQTRFRCMSVHMSVWHTYRQLSVALLVDLSKPEELWSTVDRWLDVIKTRINELVNDIQSTDKLHQSAWQRVGEQHSVRI